MKDPFYTRELLAELKKGLPRGPLPDFVPERDGEPTTAVFHRDQMYHEAVAHRGAWKVVYIISLVVVGVLISYFELFGWWWDAVIPALIIIWGLEDRRQRSIHDKVCPMRRRYRYNYGGVT